MHLITGRLILIITSIVTLQSKILNKKWKIEERIFVKRLINCKCSKRRKVKGMQKKYELSLLRGILLKFFKKKSLQIPSLLLFLVLLSYAVTFQQAYLIHLFTCNAKIVKSCGKCHKSRMTYNRLFIKFSLFSTLINAILKLSKS